MVIEKIKEVKHLKFQIKILDDKIEEIRAQIEGQAIKYSDMPRMEGYKKNIMQSTMERLLELENKKNRLQMKIDIILEELSELPEMVYKVVYYRHVDSLSWLEVANKLHYSVSQCRRFYIDAKNLKAV